MSRPNLRKTNFKSLQLNLKRCTIYEGTVGVHSKHCSRVYTPSGWEGKKVFVVLKNE